MINKNIKYLGFALAFLAPYSYGCELEAMYLNESIYETATCEINGQNYRIDLDVLGIHTEVEQTKEHLRFRGINRRYFHEMIISKTSPPVIKTIMDIYHEPFDYDDKIETCFIEPKIAIQPEHILIADNYFEQLEKMKEQGKATCHSYYSIHRSFEAIVDQMSPTKSSLQGFDYLGRDQAKIEDPNRYIAYLERYPMSSTTVEGYIQMAGWLLGYGLYDEAILLATHIANYDPDSINAYLVLGDSYLALDEKDHALQNYKQFVRLAKKTNTDIPKHIQQLIKTDAATF